MTDNLKKSKQIFFKVGAVLLLFIAVTIACFSLVKVTCYKEIMIDGESMAPTLNDGDYGYMLKKNLIGEINRFDIIIFEKNNTTYVKRVIGKPTENIRFDSRNQNLYVNDDYIAQSFISFSDQKQTFSGSTVYSLNQTISIPENYYFVLGDNRDNSFDSLHGLGFIAEDDIIGVLKCKIGETDSDGKMHFTGLKYL